MEGFNILYDNFLLSNSSYTRDHIFDFVQYPTRKIYGVYQNGTHCGKMYTILLVYLKLKLPLTLLR